MDFTNTSFPPSGVAVTISFSSFAFEDGLCEIGANAFASCTSLTEVHLPDSVVKIDEKAFYRCSALETVSFGNRLSEICDSAFASCSAATGLASASDALLRVLLYSTLLTSPSAERSAATFSTE